MITTAFILLIIGVLMIAYALRAIPDEENLSLKSTISLLAVMFIAFACFLLGQYKGAYKMLRGGYPIEHTINQQKEVTDTIIKFY